MSSNLYLDVAAFQQKVLGLDQPSHGSYSTLKQTPGYKTTMKGLHEELVELNNALDNECVSEQVDALIDLIYFALGGLYQMGIPFRQCWDEVHGKNMQKVRGETKRSEACDAAKPAGWTPPTFNFDRARDLKPFPVITSAAIMEGGIPGPLIEVANLLAKKAEDYRTGIKLSAYFPFGHESYTHMVTTKALRLVSLCKAREAGKKPNFESVRDTCLDIISYATFYIQAIDAKEVE